MKKIFSFAVVLLFIAGCSKNGNVVTTNSGLRYVDDTVGTGNVAKIGDLVTINFSGWVVRDSANLFKDWEKDTTKMKDLIGSTSFRHQPIKVALGTHSFVRGSDSAIAGMRVGGTRTIIIPSELAYGKIGFGRIIPPDSKLKLEVTLLAAKHIEPAVEWNVDSTKYKTLKDGLKYEIIKQGTGAKADSGSIVTVDYSGYLTNGKKFDSSVDRGIPFTFRLGMHQMIKGWEEGLMLLNKGAKARFVIPPQLGYGDRPMGEIPPNSTLIFDVEMVDIK